MSCGCFPTGRHYPGIAHLLKVRTRGLLEEFDPDADWVGLPIVMIDTETTGTNAAVDRVIEIALVKGVGGEVVDFKTWLLHPECAIPADSTAIHGIKDADVANAPTFRQLAPEILQAFAHALPGAYNADFDRGFILAEFLRAGYVADELPSCFRADATWLDPLVWARALTKDDAAADEAEGSGKKPRARNSNRLEAVAARLGVDLKNAHRATADAQAALEVLYSFGSDPRTPRSYAAFIQEQRRHQRAYSDRTRFWRNR